MKKELIAAFSLCLALTFVGCSDDSSSSSSAEDIEKIDDNGGKSGNFGKFSAIDDDAEEVLKAAVKGSDYESVTCDSVSTQVVAGTNYKFQCSVKDGKKTKDVVLTVFEPLPNSDKPVQLTLVTDADGEVLFESEVEFEAEDEESDDDGKKSDEGCDGCFGKFSAIDDDAEEVLKAAVKGSDYESVTCDSVSTQIVAGTNYKFQCSIKDGKETKDVVLTVFEPLPSSDKSVQLTSVTDADGEVLFESKVEFEAEDEESDDDGKKSDEGCDGCFGKFSAIDDDAEEVLNAVKGSDYESVTCDSVSTQIVAGTNYKFLCSIKDGKETKDVVVIVFEPLPSSGKPVQLTLVMDADGEVLFEHKVKFEAEDEESDDDGKKSDEGCAGCFGDYEELTAADSAVFEKANKVSDSTFVNPSAVSKQVVAGMNYRFKCELEVAEGETKDVILEVYKNVKDEIEITSVTEVVEVGFVEPTKEVSISKDCDNSADGLVTNCDVKLGEKN